MTVLSLEHVQTREMQTSSISIGMLASDLTCLRGFIRILRVSQGNIGRKNNPRFGSLNQQSRRLQFKPQRGKPHIFVEQAGSMHLYNC